MINLVLNGELNNKKEISYAFYFLTKDFDTKIKISEKPYENCTNIYYGFSETISNGINIPCIQSLEGKKLSFNRTNGQLYVSFEEQVVSPFDTKDGNIHFNFDILAISAYLITCNEEYENSERDDNSRFLSKYSNRKELINIPVFDINSQFIFEAINKLNPELKYKDRTAKFFLTHDVDSLNSRNIYVFAHNIKELLFDRKKSFKIKLVNLLKDVIYNRHRQIQNYIKLESSLGVGSEFYFIEGQKHRLGKRYKLSSIKKEIKILKSNPKSIIGLHTNFFSYDDENLIRNEIEAIENATATKVISGRNHYLRFKVPDTWIKLSKAGIKCDSTIGYSDENGFRAGTSQAFIPFDLVNKKLIDIYEVPMIVMDGIIMEKDLSFQDKWQEIKALIDYSFKYKGTVSILWHQRVILDKEYEEMYRKIICYINDNNGKFVLSDELILDYEIQKKKISELLCEV